MSFSLKSRVALLVAIAALFTATAWQSAAAFDMTHVLKGIVKSVDKDSKTMVVKAEDGTEHTIKWTDKTTMAGMKDTGKGIEEGSKVSVKYTEAGGEKTAVAVKDASKDTAKEMK